MQKIIFGIFLFWPLWTLCFLTSTHPKGILPNGYNPPDNFCWDQSCSDSPIRDDPDLEDYNVDDVVMQFIKIAKNQVSITYTQTHATR